MTTTSLKLAALSLVLLAPRAGAKDTTPVRAAFNAPSLSRVSCDKEKKKTYGLDLGLPGTKTCTVAGFQLGLGSAAADKFYGPQIGGGYTSARTLYGLQFGMALADVEEMYGIQVSGIGNNLPMKKPKTRVRGLQLTGISNNADDLRGLQLGPVNYVTGDLSGLQAGLANLNYAGSGGGVQVGAYNDARRVYGLQIGIVNKCQDLHGVQLGLVNIISDAKNRRINLPFTILLNVSWGPNQE